MTEPYVEQAKYDAVTGALKVRVDELERERGNWTETAMQNAKNTEYYRSLVIQVGEMLGADVYQCDDGTFSKDVLCDKVPECLRGLLDLHQETHDAIKQCHIDAARELTEARAEIEQQCKTIQDAFILCGKIDTPGLNITPKMVMERLARGTS